MMNWKHLLLFALLIVAQLRLPAQAPKRWTSADIHKAIQKLSFLGSALYVAAHPDDENQRLIAYLSNEANATTTYLAMTRGDGGQNEIGPEIEELLGVIRTQELLAARRIDGGNQMFPFQRLRLLQNPGRDPGVLGAQGSAVRCGVGHPEMAARHHHQPFPARG